VTELDIRACIRLGVTMYLWSPRTGRVWEVRRCEHDPTRLRGYPADHGISGTGWLTPRQVEWHLQNKPHNFTTTLLCPLHPIK
jgi:hypothetical protein